MKEILVTGGAGYVGSILLRRLIALGYGVTCIDTLDCESLQMRVINLPSGP
jgi:nucleoside-diphosphate-sugar epimerase